MSNQIYKKKLLIGHWNCNSTKSKEQIFNKFLSENNFDIFCLNETKLSNDSKISIDNYNIVEKNRNKRGGGVAILIKNSIKFEIIDVLDKYELELICVKIKTKNHAINIISIYNPPISTKNRDKKSIYLKTSINLDRLC